MMHQLGGPVQNHHCADLKDRGSNQPKVQWLGVCCEHRHFVFQTHPRGEVTQTLYLQGGHAAAVKTCNRTWRNQVTDG